jgi:acetate kinase
VRAAVCQGLDSFGIAVDAAKNEAATGKTADISAAGSRIRVYTIPTDEELLIARDTAAVANLDL